MQQLGRLNVDGIDTTTRIDRAQVEKKIAEQLQAKGIIYKKGSDRFTEEQWPELNELAQKHADLPGEQLTKKILPWLQTREYSLPDVKQTIKNNLADVPPDMKIDWRSFAGTVPALLAIASKKSNAGSSGAVTGKEHGTEVVSKMAPASPTPASAKSAQPASSGDSAQTGNAEVSEEESDSDAEEDIEVIEKPLSMEEMLQKLKVRGVVHGQDPKKVARIVDIENALKGQKVEFDPKLKKEDKIRLLYDAMRNV